VDLSAKNMKFLSIIVFPAIVILLGCATTDEISEKEDLCSKIGGDYNPAEDFNPSELRELALNPDESSRRLMWLINRAAAEKKGGF
jgi:hypothetical protein